MLQYALMAATLPGGHLFQVKIDGVTGYAELSAPDGAIANAVDEFTNPDVGASKAANNAALGKKPKKPKTPAAKDTTVTVLNGNAQPGSAASASYLLAQRGYQTLLPPNNAEPNAPTQDYFHSQIYFDAEQEGREAGGARAREALRAGRREAAAEGSRDPRARSRRDAALRHRVVVPRLDRRGAGRRDAEAASRR